MAMTIIGSRVMTFSLAIWPYAEPIVKHDAAVGAISARVGS